MAPPFCFSNVEPPQDTCEQVEDMREWLSVRVPNAQESNSDAWKLRFSAVLRSDRHADKSWMRLANAGLDMEDVSTLLWLACDFEGSPGYDFISHLGDKFKDQAKQSRRLAKRLAEDAKTIRAVCGDAAQKDLLAKLETCIEELQSSEKEIRERFSKRSFNPAIYRIFLIRDIKEKTKRPFFKEFSFLLDAAYKAHGQEPPALGAEAIRKFYQRYVKKLSAPSVFGCDPATLVTVALAITFLLECLNKLTRASVIEKADAG